MGNPGGEAAKQAGDGVGGRHEGTGAGKFAACDYSAAGCEMRRLTIRRGH